MNWLGRKWVQPSPECSRYRSISSCIRVKRNFCGSNPMLDSFPESFTPYSTHALFQTSIKAHCVSTIRGSEDEIISTRSIPCNAEPSVSRRTMAAYDDSSAGNTQHHWYLH